MAVRLSRGGRGGGRTRGQTDRQPPSPPRVLAPTTAHCAPAAVRHPPCTGSPAPPAACPTAQHTRMGMDRQTGGRCPPVAWVPFRWVSPQGCPSAGVLHLALGCPSAGVVLGCTGTPLYSPILPVVCGYVRVSSCPCSGVLRVPSQGSLDVSVWPCAGLGAPIRSGCPHQGWVPPSGVSLSHPHLSLCLSPSSCSRTTSMRVSSQLSPPCRGLRGAQPSSA